METELQKWKPRAACAGRRGERARAQRRRFSSRYPMLWSTSSVPGSYSSNDCLMIPEHQEKRYKVLKGRELHESSREG